MNQILDRLSDFLLLCVLLAFIMMIYFVGVAIYDEIIDYRRSKETEYHFEQTEEFRNEFR